jgi:hypothetical protein
MVSTGKQEKIIVIVRALGDEPVKLNALSEHDGAIEVCGDNEELSLGFNAANVYSFDDGLFQKLRRAYSRSEHSRLNELWKQANPFRMA